MMYLCQFDLNLAIGSEVKSVDKASSVLYYPDDLKIRLRSPNLIIY